MWAMPSLFPPNFPDARIIIITIITPYTRHMQINVYICAKICRQRKTKCFATCIIWAKTIRDNAWWLHKFAYTLSFDGCTRTLYVVDIVWLWWHFFVILVNMLQATAGSPAAQFLVHFFLWLWHFTYSRF